MFNFMTSVQLGCNYLFCTVYPQYSDSTAPDVYFHFETYQCWTNHGAQFCVRGTSLCKCKFIKLNLLISNSCI